VGVTKQEQADEILDEEVWHCNATSAGVETSPLSAVYELQKADLAAGA
jgi:hypothetical protein